MQQLFNPFSLRFLIVVFVLFAENQVLTAQNIGHTTITFNDPTRSGGFGSGGGAGRQIQTEIYYNSITAGDNVPLQNIGTSRSPVIVFGHGFVMDWESYKWLWDSLCGLGYVIALPRTEGNITANHAEFAADIKLVAQKLNALKDSSSSLFYQKLNGRVAIGGHSMGGGCSIMAFAGSGAHCVFNFAAAETNGNAASLAAPAVTAPTLVFAGGNDCVAPPFMHAKKIYNALPQQTCAYYIELNDGQHCQFNNANTICSFGELSCSTSPLTREQQMSKVLRHLVPFLQLHLQGNVAGAAQFLSAYNTATDIVKENHCTNLNVQVLDNKQIDFFYYNNTQQQLHMHNSGKVQVISLQGNLVKQQFAAQNTIIDLGDLARGVYLVLQNGNTSKISVQ